MINARDVNSAWKGVPWPRVFAQESVADRLFLRSALIRKDLLPRYAPRMPLTWTIAGEADCQRAERREGPLNEDGVFYEEGWCLKPADSSNAFGIRFCADDDLEKTYNEARAGDERSLWVAQRNTPNLRIQVLDVTMSCRVHDSFSQCGRFSARPANFVTEHTRRAKACVLIHGHNLSASPARRPHRSGKVSPAE